MLVYISHLFNLPAIGALGSRDDVRKPRHKAVLWCFKLQQLSAFCSGDLGLPQLLLITQDSGLTDIAPARSGLECIFERSFSSVVRAFALHTLSQRVAGSIPATIILTTVCGSGRSVLLVHRPPLLM